MIESVVANGQRVIAVHAEDQMIMMKNQINIRDSNDVAMHCKWRSLKAVCLLLNELLDSKKHNRRVHILHITTEQEMEFLSRNKDVASVELLANHLSLHAPECYERLGTRNNRIHQ